MAEAESHGSSLTCVLVSGHALSFRVRRSDRQLPDSLWPSGLLHSSRPWLSHVRLCGEQKGILQHVFQDGWLKLGLLQASQICHVHSGLYAGKETQASDPLRTRSKARGTERPCYTQVILRSPSMGNLSPIPTLTPKYTVGFLL